VTGHDYTGIDRRFDSAEIMAMLARIDERTQSMREKMDTLATCERVDAVENKINAHIADHETHNAEKRWKIGTIISGILGAAALALGIVKLRP